MEVLSRGWRCCPGDGGAVQGMKVLSRGWRCCAGNGGAVQGMEVLCSEWRCCADEVTSCRALAAERQYTDYRIEAEKAVIVAERFEIHDASIVE